jgi:hypothetical protein
VVVDDDHNDLPSRHDDHDHHYYYGTVVVSFVESIVEHDHVSIVSNRIAWFVVQDTDDHPDGCCYGYGCSCWNLVVPNIVVVVVVTIDIVSKDHHRLYASIPKRRVWGDVVVVRPHS